MNSKMDRETVERGEDGGDVMLSVKTSMKPSCFILDMLQAGQGFLCDARK